MAKQPHNEHELEIALTRFAGSNLAAAVPPKLRIEISKTCCFLENAQSVYHFLDARIEI